MIALIAPFASKLAMSAKLAKLLGFCCQLPVAVQPLVYDSIGLVFDALLEHVPVAESLSAPDLLDNPALAWKRLARVIILHAAIVAEHKDHSIAERSLLRCALCASNFFQYVAVRLPPTECLR